MNARILEHPTLFQRRQRKGLVSALELTEEMLVMAQSGKWEQVKNLEIERRMHIDSCLSRPIEDHDLELFSDALGTLLSLNDRLVHIIQDARVACVQEQQGTQKALSMANRYLDI